MKHPLNWENMVDANDLIHRYNPNLYNNHLHHIGNYAQTESKIDPEHPTGLEPPPPDYQYDVPH